MFFIGVLLLFAEKSEGLFEAVDHQMVVAAEETCKDYSINLLNVRVHKSQLGQVEGYHLEQSLRKILLLACGLHLSERYEHWCLIEAM